MARVKICRLCDAHNEPDELFCADCGTSLADVRAVDAAELERLAAQEEATNDAPQPVGDSPPPAAAAGAHTVRDQGAAPCTLLFPWGSVPIAGEFGIGREAGFSSICQQLDAYATVSRQHALVAVAADGWTVRDLGSTNGTYVNGARLAQGETRPIANGDQIGFSRGLQVEVQIGPTGGANG